MPSDPIERLMRDDFDAARAGLNHDGFCERMLSLLERKRRARLGVILAAGGIGAALAGAQFAKMSGAFASFAPLTGELSVYGQSAGLSASLAPQLLAAAAITVAFLATALVLKAEQ